MKYVNKIYDALFHEKYDYSIFRTLNTLMHSKLSKIPANANRPDTYAEYTLPAVNGILVMRFIVIAIFDKML